MKPNVIYALIVKGERGVRGRLKPGPPYWFRDRDRAMKFADENNRIYPHLKQLVAIPFPIFNRGICSFNPDTYREGVIILRLDNEWQAVRADADIPRLWPMAKALQFMT